jgi:multiple sugar transport system permease protein
MLDGIPLELDEAARVDGATTGQVLSHVILPLARPGLAVTFILTWIFAWNEYLFAATLTSSAGARTVTTALAEYVSVTGTNWGEMAAMAFLTTLPALVVLGFVQKHIVTGLTFGALKG